ncbi:GNRHR [Lepeophtheirus salmonis]|uniref:GNRHR n=1 Tax=Lepeophtheirus salmonis TaxID=72036 RepID=A0A7R8CKM4_LEPSM|nr:GNRHR [Lepeophtheirus salmonis]CAF2849770.1 GNRHR [Lepeophtheirus salmonis]
MKSNNYSLHNASDYSSSMIYSRINGDVEKDEEKLPSDMTFNSAHIISITGYSTLFIISSLANLTVLKILVRRYKKIKSRVNLLLIHLAIADLLYRVYKVQETPSISLSKVGDSALDRRRSHVEDS